jgi:enamine deaminase RidA (YjgF/YER057c/UK114 family)
MTDIKRWHPTARMNQMVAYNGLVFTAGQVAEENAGNSVTEQTAEILRNIDSLLAEAGSDKSRILSATIYLADIASFAEMNTVWDAWVAPDGKPVRATVEARLAGPEYAVEIAVIAAA